MRVVWELCSRRNTVCSAVSPGCSLARTSPATINAVAGSRSGLSLDCVPSFSGSSSPMAVERLLRRPPENVRSHEERSAELP